MNLPPAGLVLWHARRALWPGVLVVALLLLMAWGADESPHASDELNRVWQAQSIWSAGAFGALIVLILRAAQLGKRYQDADRAWIGARPLTRGQVLGAELFGLAFAAGGLAFGIWGFAGALDRTPAASRSHLVTLENPGALLVEGDRAFVWNPPSGLTLLDQANEVGLAVTIGRGSGPTVSVRFAVVDRAGAQAQVTQRAFGPTRLRLALPPGFDTQSATLHVARDGPGALLAVLPKTVEFFGPPGSGWVSPRLRLAALLLAALISAATVSFAAGMWIRPGLAAALTAVTLFTFGLRGASPAIAGFAEAVTGMEHGIAPPAIGPAYFGLALLTVLAFGFALLGRRHGGAA